MVMNNINIIGVYLFASISIMGACSKDSLPDKASASYFPNTAGSYWIYEVNDTSQINYHSGYPRVYDVTVSIIGTKIMIDGKEATMWAYKYPWGIDTNFVRIVGDTVKTFDKYYSSTIRDFDFPRETFITPFVNQTGWNGKLLWIDSFSVASVANLPNGFLNFDNCFDIYHYYYGSQDLRYYDNYWFKPNIGFVKIHYRRFQGSPWEYYTWSLKKYYLY
jgi:hypothetical protein